MSLTCGRCGAESPGGAEYCGRCGARLTPGDDETAGALLRDLEALGAGSSFADRYVVAGLLRRDGLTQTFRAYDRLLRRDVEIKTATLENRSHAPTPLAEVLREARMLGRLHHPTIPPVYDLGVVPPASVYYSTSLMEGAPFLSDSPRAADEGDAPSPFGALRGLVEILARACEGVAYAHRQGVIHRDLKTNYIIVLNGDVRVVGWELSRPAGADGRDDLADLPRGWSRAYEGLVGCVVGTPAYMAPEQARGEEHEIDTRTDVYALGGVLYQVLFRRPPNARETVMEMLAACVAPKTPGVLAPEFASAPRKYRRAMQAATDGLTSIAMKALSVEKAQRYASVDEMIAALRAWLKACPESS